MNNKRTCLWALFFVGMMMQFLASAQETVKKPHVYGAPGPGLIRVEADVLGGWKHPGIYWVPKGTTLVDFVKKAGLPEVCTGVIVNRDDGVFRMYQMDSEKVTLILQNGDLICLGEGAL